jgi:hypothetical protein
MVKEGHVYSVGGVRVLLFRFIRVLVFCCGLVLLGSCVSPHRTVVQGLQPGYAGAQFARYVFLPVVVQVNPSRKAAIDRAAVENDAVVAGIEKRVVAAFRGQSAVVGVSPAALRAHFQAYDRPLRAPQEILLKRGEELRGLFFDARDQVSAECSERQNYIDFFVHCVSGLVSWRESLAQLSEKAFNADAAMIVVLTDLDKSMREGAYAISASASVLLVDMNNGRLVWANEGTRVSVAGSGAVRFPDWDPLFEKLFEKDFWLGFPGLSN